MLRFIHFGLSLFLPSAFAPGLAKAGEDASAASTFECISLEWKPGGASESDVCQTEYRAKGSTDWRSAQELWFDRRDSQYRGSIVGLLPETTYEVKLSLENGRTRMLTSTTWSEDFPIASTVHVPSSSGTTFKVTQSGTPAGYVLYTAAPGRDVVIDGRNKANVCIEIDASYVIVRGLTLKGARVHGIQLRRNAHHVVIENCDISGWGQVAKDGWGSKDHCGIHSDQPSIHHIVVQRNKVHHPNGNSNNWSENRPLYKNGSHPNGPQAISFFKNSAGNHVIRYNEVYSDMRRMFNDGIGGGDNFNKVGFPGKNSDVYGNIVTHCWDNPIELEGGGRNVRVWGNYTDYSYTSIATVPVAEGPIYVFRNVANKFMRDPKSGGVNTRFLKAGSVKPKGKFFGDGRTYVYHNTLLQESDGRGKLLGASRGIDGGAGVLTNTVTRNNVWYVKDPSRQSIDDNNPAVEGSYANDLNYDLYNAAIRTALPDAQTHGIRRAPAFDPRNGNMFDPFKEIMRFGLLPGSPGYDAGQVIANFNDGFAGAAPDMGANESGFAMQFGVKAYIRGGSAARQEAKTR